MLYEPVPLLPPTQLGDVHFIAIGGAGMSAIALLYAELGVRVSGSDRSESAALATLRAAGITTYVGHAAAQLGAAQTVVVSSAIGESNPELAAARQRGLRVWHRSTALGALVMDRAPISVTGTHGKTTTSAMTAQVLAAAGDPGYVVGAVLANTGRASWLGVDPAFVIEADESDGSFRQYPSRVVVVTNIEADHLDNWGTPEAYYRGYGEVVRAATVDTVVACADDAGAARLIGELRSEGRNVVTYGWAEAADVRLVHPGFAGTGATARMIIGDAVHELQLRVPGRHNLLNAAAAFTVGERFGVPAGTALAALAEFRGTARRFEFIGEAGGVRIFDDYAHHPTEVAATLAAARTAAGDGRVIACFQPHLFSRTQEFYREFASALSAADEIVLFDVYPAREEPIPGVTGALIAIEVAHQTGGARVHYVETLAAGPARIASLAVPGDLVLTIGAGDVTTVGPQVAGLLGGADGEIGQ